jgi:putative FmdB family regulatory protein
MPTYDYCCDACGHRFEQFQSITARPLRKCPICRARTLRRLLGTGGGIIFKGSGFYQTDYRSDSYKKAVDAEKKATGSGNGKDTASKPAEKPAAHAPAAKPANPTSSRG